ncbi:MAG TPA: PAS domain S-box protein, partial [Elusimicrobiales bacterium]|nr:PAS domain S-box protein [Elusimicrobiales bacterium]
MPPGFREKLALAGFERRLKSGRGPHKALFDGLKEGLALYRVNLRKTDSRALVELLYCNPAFDLMTGRALKTPQGRVPAEDFPCKGAQWPQLLEKTARTGQTQTFETHCLARQLWLSVTLLRAAPGMVAAITENLSELRKTETDLRILMEGQGLPADSPHIPYAAALDMTVRFVGPQVRNYGYEPSEITGRPLMEFMAPQDRQALQDSIQDALKTGRTSFSQFRVVDKLGREIWFAGAAKVYRDGEGEPLGFCGTIYNLSHTKEAEEKFQKAFQTATAATAIIMDGAYLEVNDAFTAMTGYSRAEVLSKPAGDFNIINPHILERAGLEFKKKGALRLFEAEFTRKNGTRGTALFSAARLTLGGKQAVLAS